MKSSPETWSVGEVAERFGIATHVLRHWEDMGLLAPARDGSGRRRYDRDDLVRVGAVLANKRAGMSLEQVRLLFDGNAAGRHEVLTAHLADIDRNIRALEASREMAQHTMDCRAHDITTCPRFRQRLDETIEGRVAWHQHPVGEPHGT